MGGNNYMKKIYISIILITLFLMSGCNGEHKEEENMINNNENIMYEEGIYQNKDWNSLEFSIEMICVPNKETAVSIANDIMINFQKQGKFNGYIPQHVFLDTEDNFWVVSFWPNIKNDNSTYIGASFSIAIQKENAQILKMWIEE